MTISPNYGTYHHTSAGQSENIRKELRKAFYEMFEIMDRTDTVNWILDAGCGLGYLCEVSAFFFKNAKVTGVDLFGTSSLPEGNMQKAIKNMEAVGLESRVNFFRSDLLKPVLPADSIDLCVSSLVFHNLGGERFKAYSNIFEILRKNGYFIVGDFFMKGSDRGFLKELFSIVKVKENIRNMPEQYSILVLRK